MRQISIPLVFLEYNFFILKNEFLQSCIMLEKSENRESLVENDYSASESTLATKPNYVPTNKTIVKPAVASEQVYFLLFLIFHHLHIHLSRFENPLSYMYQGITFSTIECGIQRFHPSLTDVLLVIYCYQLLILVLNFFSYHMVGTPSSDYSSRYVLLVVVIVNICCNLSTYKCYPINTQHCNF